MRNILLIIFALVSVAFGGRDTFNFVADTLWSTAANWSSGSTPATTDTVYFTSASNGLCVQDIDDTIKSLVFVSGHTNILKRKVSNLSIAGNITFISGDSINTGTSTITITDVCTFTSANKIRVYDLTINCADSTKLVTFADTLKTATGGDFTLTQGKATFSGYGIVAGGDVLFNNGWNNYGNFITMDGTNSTLHNEITVGTQTATSCVFTFNSTGHTLDLDKAANNNSYILAASSGVTITNGVSQSVNPSSGAALIIGNNATLTHNGAGITFRPTGTVNLWTIGTGVTFNGTGSFTHLAAVSSVITIPATTYTGTGTLTLTISTSTDVDLGGNFVWNGNLIYSQSSTSTRYFKTNNYDFNIGGSLLAGTTSITATVVCKFIYGSSVCHMKSIDFASRDSSGSTYVDSMMSSTRTVSGSYLIGKNKTIRPGTSTVTIDSTGSITSAGKHFWVLKNASSATHRVTLVDSVQADSAFENNSGKLAVGANTIRTKNYTNISPDSMTSTGNLILTGNFLRNTTASYATGGGIFFDTTTNRSQTLTANSAQLRQITCKWLTFLDSAKVNKLTVSDAGKITIPASVGVRVDTIGKLDGSVGAQDSFVSSSPGTQARWWIPGPTTTSLYRYWKDINQMGGTSTAAATNTNGGNNSNVLFLGTLSCAQSPQIDTVGKAIVTMANVLSYGTADSFNFAALPGGLSGNKTTGQVTGTPTTMTAKAGYRLVAYGSNKTDSAVGYDTITVKDALPIISYTSPAIDTVGKAASYTVTSTGGAVVSYALTTGTLVPTMALNTSTGAIAGTPGAAKAATVYRITATNGTGTGYFDWTESVVVVVVDVDVSVTAKRRSSWSFGFGYGFR